MKFFNCGGWPMLYVINPQRKIIETHYGYFNFSDGFFNSLKEAAAKK